MSSPHDDAATAGSRASAPFRPPYDGSRSRPRVEELLAARRFRSETPCQSPPFTNDAHASATATGPTANIVGKTLVWMGARGPFLLVGTLAAGLLAPSLGEDVRPLLPASAFLLTFGSFLAATLSRPEPDLTRGRTLLTLVWLGLGVPCVAALAVSLVSLPPVLKFGVLASSLAPPIGSAAAIATLLGLRPRLALIGSVTLTLGAPASVPALAKLFDTGLSFHAAVLTIRLLVIIASSAVLAALVWRFRARTARTFPDPNAAAGLAVSGLMVVGLVAASGVRSHSSAEAHEFEKLLVIVILVNAGACLLGAVLFAKFGAAAALTVGLLSGNRNFTLVWAAASASLPATMDAYFVASVIPILSLPLVLKLAIGAWGRVVRK